MLGNNIFQNVADGTGAGIFKVASEQDDDGNDLFTVPEQANTDFAAYFGSAGNTVADVGVDAENPTASGDVAGATFEGLDAWFQVVGYKGAFRPNENWAQGWSLSLGNVQARENDYNSVSESAVWSARMLIYPNPVTESATVEFENPSSSVHTFRLFDLTGRSVRIINNIYESRFVIDRNGLTDGIYIYTLSNPNGIVAEGKLILK
jgi:hypothetical protein